jgi:hypothetical protein
MRFMSSQHNPLLALGYLVMVAVLALRHSWHPARAAARKNAIRAAIVAVAGLWGGGGGGGARLIPSAAQQEEEGGML